VYIAKRHYIDGTWYLLNNNGAMASNTVIDGYQLGESGTLVKQDSRLV